MSQINLTKFYRNDYEQTKITVPIIRKITVPIRIYKEENCIACLELIPSIGYSKCGHIVYCYDCTKYIKSDKCPICRDRSNIFVLK